ncbi:serine hydrolase domain-containing protein [Streptomyces sp. NPDC059567]|uniref:serine hydrolase domain-containing protein n=1 Tax=Streptomyces sp. NPDC059567 TaxID=3346867 RepID=UPI0036B84A5F
MAGRELACRHPVTEHLAGLGRHGDRSLEGVGVPGVVAEVRDGRGVWRGSSGAADLGTGHAAQARDRFRAGSVTKSFVATVVLQLVAEGKVKLDDDIESRLPGVVPGGEHITVRQLLHHTSGLANYTDVLLKKPDPVRAPNLSGSHLHGYEWLEGRGEGAKPTGLTMPDVAAKAAMKVLSTALCRAE